MCESCFDTGTILDPDHGAIPCAACRLKRNARRQEVLLKKIPKRYRGVTLEGLKPQAELHKDQATIIEFMKANPHANYYLCGENDTGKTHFMWALYEHAVRAGRNVIATTLHDWIEKNIASYRENQKLTPFTIADLQQSTFPYSIFIDDIDKKKMTEYVAEMLFNFVDSVYRFKHQIVVTSQLDPERSINKRASLIDHFCDPDTRYGVGIARRIVNEETAVFRMF